MSTDDPDQTRATEDAIASDETLRHDPDQPTPSPDTDRVIRVRRSGPVTKLGRYSIVRELGKGGMGAVYEAEDPELGRKVAIKVLRTDRGDDESGQRLRREAQALAKLVHPNVVTVYDVGFESGQVFIVMQLVPGETIDRWLRERKASATDVVAMFCQAGRGLAAAHAAGLVHCDFKPSNVFVDDAGVAQVGDFGLARIEIEPEVTTPSKRGRARTVAGTPSYMAPEQFGGEATAASDQFSFCVSLWEVLAGQRPYEDVEIGDSAGAAARELRPWPKRVAVPPRVVRALTRGLASRSEDRFPSMTALLTELDVGNRRRTWLLGGAAVLALAGGVALAISMTAPPAARAPVEPKVVAAGEPDLAAKRSLTAFEYTACAYAPTIESDGTVVFDRTAGDAVDLYRMPLAGGEPVQLTTAPTWEWRAHAGRRAGEVIHLVTTQTVEGNAIAFLDLESKRSTIAAEVFAVDAAVAGEAIFYISSAMGELREIAAGHDTMVVPVKDGDKFTSLAVSPDGTHVAAIQMGRDKVKKLCLVGTASRKMECVASNLHNSRPAFGVDGRFIYYAARDGVHRLELATRTDTVVLAEEWAIGGLAIAPDGRALVYSNCGSRTQLLDMSTTPPTRIAENVASPTVAGKDHDVIAWVRQVRGGSVLMARVNGREIELTAPELGSVSSPHISPDGEHIAFVVTGAQTGIREVWIKGSNSVQTVTEDARDDKPIWIDNKRLAFNRQLDAHSGPAVFTVTRDGAELRQLAKDRELRGSRDGQLLVSTRQALHWIDSKSGKERPGPALGVTEPVPFMSLSPDGRWLMYQLGTHTTQMFRMSLAPLGKAERVGAQAGGQTAQQGAITDDGRVLVAPRSWAGDLIVVPARGDTRY